MYVQGAWEYKSKDMLAFRRPVKRPWPLSRCKEVLEMEKIYEYGKIYEIKSARIRTDCLQISCLGD